jgi:tricorn protease-like protein
MFKRTALSLLLVLSVATAGFSFQQRITTHKTYALSDSDGAGNIYFIKSESGQNDNVWKMDSTGAGLTRITNGTNPAKLFKLLPGGEKAVVVTDSDNSDTITLINADGSSPLELYSGELFITQIAVSPDGQKVAFTAQQPGSDESFEAIYLVNTDGTSLRMLGTGYSGKPKKIVRLRSFDVTGSTLTKDNANSVGICFSSSSDHVFFRSASIFSTGLKSVDTAGTNVVDMQGDRKSVV